jgi:hypothetical protein
MEIRKKEAVDGPRKGKQGKEIKRQIENLINVIQLCLFKL